MSPDELRRTKMRHPFAHLYGLQFALAYFAFTGATCATCGYGTRATSKRWAKCKKCGARTPRKTEAEFFAALRSGPAPQPTEGTP